MTAAAVATGPARLPEAVRTELRRAFNKRFEVPIVVTTNGTALALAWFLLPPSLSRLLFTFRGPLAFVVLAGRMYSDVPATNLLGSDPGRRLERLDDRAALRNMQRAKNLVLWLLISLLAMTIAIVVGIHDKRPLATIFTALWIAVVPLGALGVAAWLGIFFPYQAVPVKQRRAQRKLLRRKVVRWLILVMAPWGVVPGLVFLISLPTIGLWAATYESRRGRLIPDTDFASGVAIGCVVAALFWIFGTRLGAWFARRRRDTLARFLADPDRG